MSETLLRERAACRFSDALGEPPRTGKQRPCQNADETFFAAIFTEHVLN